MRKIFSKEVLRYNPSKAEVAIRGFIHKQTFGIYKRKGIVVGLSGGIDSSVVATLCVEAVGHKNTIGVILPERESSREGARYAGLVARRLGIKAFKIDITPILEAVGIYRLKEGIVKRIFPEYKSYMRYRIIMPPSLLECEQLNVPYIQIEVSKGRMVSKIMNPDDYLGILSATNIKHRIRMSLLYSYAERNNFIVAGTTNKTEYILGFFVKYGDGGADIEPIRHLYKTQVYHLAVYLNIPSQILRRKPTPDTFSLPVSDEEFFFRIPYDKLDLLLYAWQYNIAIDKVAHTLGLKDSKVKQIYQDFATKYKYADYLRACPTSISHIPT